MGEKRAMFQEALAQDLDRTTKELLDSADRLSWTDGMNLSSIDRWIDSTNAALGRLRAARMRKVRTVRA
jgi:hypothetical protein